MFKLQHSAFFVNRNFTLLWLGEGISVLGDFVFDTMLVLWIGTILAQGQSWAPMAVSGVLLCASLPALLLGPVAGVFVDRWDRRVTMLVMDALRCSLILCLLLITGLLPLPFLAGVCSPLVLQLAAIYIIVVLSSVCSQFFSPAQMALIGTIVPEEQRIRASSLSMIMANIGWVAGPAIAGLLFSMVGVQWAIVINAASFAFSFLMIFLIKVPRSVESHKIEQPHFGREFLAGLKFSLGNRVVSTLLVTSVIFSLCAGALNALYLFFLTQNLHASADLYGLFCALPGLGGVVGSALAGKLAQRIGASRTRWLSLLLWSCVGLLFARQVHFVPAAICVFLIGMLNMGIAVAASPLILKVTPEKMRGRVFSVFSTLSTCASLLSLSLAGLAYSTVLHSFHTSLFGLPVGPVDLMYSVGALLVGVGGLYEMLTTFYQKL